MRKPFEVCVWSETLLSYSPALPGQTLLPVGEGALRWFLPVFVITFPQVNTDFLAVTVHFVIKSVWFFSWMSAHFPLDRLILYHFFKGHIKGHKTYTHAWIFAWSLSSSKKERKTTVPALTVYVSPIMPLPICFDLLMCLPLTYCHLPLAESSMKYVWLTHDNRMSKRKPEEHWGRWRGGVFIVRSPDLVWKVVSGELPHVIILCEADKMWWTHQRRRSDLHCESFHQIKIKK